MSVSDSTVMILISLFPLRGKTDVKIDPRGGQAPTKSIKIIQIGDIYEC